MSVLVTDLIDQSLVTLMHPRANRITREMLLQFFNETQHDLAVTLRCLEDDYYFNLEAGEGAYSYPVNRVQVKKIRVAKNDAPTTIGDYRVLDEMFEDEFAYATSGSRPTGYVSHYFARASWFELVNVPTADLIDGGIVTITRIPTWIPSLTAQVTMELPDFCRTTVQKGMEVKAMNAGRDRLAASDAWQKWMATAAQDIENKIADPAIDRRASLRPPSRRWSRGLR